MAGTMTATRGARYDGLADWYDAFNEPGVARNQAELARLLGPGDGRCLDLGCGTGQYDAAIRGTGRTVVGLDRSGDQLRIAHGRTGALVQADAAALPFPDRVFPTVCALWVSTDVDDFPALLAEAARVLIPGGLLVSYGVHPCFNGPCIEKGPDGAVVVHPTYRTAGWHEPAPWWRLDGLRRQIGMRHVPLADLFNAFIDAGLAVERVAEPFESEPLPWVLAIRARRRDR